MKKLLTLIFLSGLFLAGCQDSSLDPVSPQNGNISISNLPANTPTTLDKLDYSSLKLNKDGGLYGIFNKVSQKSVILHNTIDGSTGGNLNLNQFFTFKNDGKLVTLNVTLHFSSDAFEGDDDIYMIVDPDDFSISFYPPIEKFNSSVTLDATIEGIDLSKLGSNSGNVKFVYFPDDARLPVQVINNNGVTLESKTATVSVKGAQLMHFSRYGWAT